MVASDSGLRLASDFTDIRKLCPAFNQCIGDIKRKRKSVRLLWRMRSHSLSPRCLEARKKCDENDRHAYDIKLSRAYPLLFISLSLNKILQDEYFACKGDMHAA